MLETVDLGAVKDQGCSQDTGQGDADTGWGKPGSLPRRRAGHSSQSQSTGCLAGRLQGEGERGAENHSLAHAKHTVSH